MTLLLWIVLGSVALMSLGLALFWSYWAVRISAHGARKITRRLRAVAPPPEEGKPVPDRERELEPVG